MVDGADVPTVESGAGCRSMCDRGYGPDGAWRAYHEVIDDHAAKRPETPAVQDAGGSWSYSELRDASLIAAAFLAAAGVGAAARPPPSWAERPTAPRPLAVWAPRSRELVALCVGAWRLGLPVVALSRDMSDAVTEADRNRQAMRDLRPVALVADDRAPELLSAEGVPDDAVHVPWADFAAALVRTDAKSSHETFAAAGCKPFASPESVLAYVYTGGTTKASKCVTVTHAMALWEAENYATALLQRAGPGDRMLQYSSLYWGAAVLGQISIAFAVGACVCIGGRPEGCGGAGDALRQLAADTDCFAITVLGVVPSQLRGAWPDGPASAPASVHTVVVWADKCPPELSRRWRTQRIQVIDLLIASEYWLALYSDCSTWSDGAVEKHVYRPLPTLDVRFLADAGDGARAPRDALPGEVGEMYLAGPTTSPGYVCPDGHVSLDFHEASRTIDGKLYLRTRDQLLLLEGGGLVYSGRADSMMKHGGTWVDADALQDAVTAVPGVALAAVLPSAQGLDAFVVLRGAAPGGGEAATFRTLSAARRALPASTPGGCRVHLRTELPLHAATAKVDRKALTAELSAMREDARRYQEKQESWERVMVSHYAAWGSVGAAVVCGPEVLRAALQALRAMAGQSRGPQSALAVAAAAARLCAACAGRLLTASELLAAATYLHEGVKDGAWAKAFSQALQHWGLPNAVARWLPLASAALLPLPWLRRLFAGAIVYLAWRREGDAALALGLGCAPAAALLPLPLGARARAALVAAIAACAAWLRRRSARELAAYVAAAPGIYWQALPKFLSDDFGYALKRSMRARRPRRDDTAALATAAPLGRLAAALVQPAWEQELVWDDKTAVVDAGNTWDLVELYTPEGRNAWNSVGVRVRLGKTLGAPVESFLQSAQAATVAAAKPGNGSGAGSPGAGAAGGLAGLVERICGGRDGDALHGVDSMQAIQLAEGIRRELGRQLGVSDVLRCQDLGELAAAVESSPRCAENGDAERRRRSGTQEERDPWRIWLCGLGPKMCTVDWMVSRVDQARHIDLGALQRAVDRLVAGHAVLRARNGSELPAYEATYATSALWQLWGAAGCQWTRSTLGRIASASIFYAWPRTTVLDASAPGARVQLLTPTVGEVVGEYGTDVSFDQRAFWTGGALYNAGPPEQLFKVCAIPIFDASKVAEGARDDNAATVALGLAPEDVRWYVYAVLDHGYCDGPTGAPLFSDLLRLYAEESGEDLANGGALAREERRPTEALETLQRRLQQSLKPVPEAFHPNDDIFHDGLSSFGWRRGFQRHIQYDEQIMTLLRVASREVLGCSVDVAWLTVISAAFFRLFPALTRLDFYLIVTCRDGPGEEGMIGYLSSRKLLQIDVGDTRRATLLGLADLIGTVRRQRSWRRPRPLEVADAIQLNIVSQAADGLPMGFQEVRCPRSGPREWDRGSASNMNLRLDQTSRDGWDFRLQSHDASWGSNWSSYFAQAMGSVIVDMALRPTGAIVPS